MSGHCGLFSWQEIDDQTSAIIIETSDFSTLGAFNLCGFDLWVGNSEESHQCMCVCAGVHTNIFVDAVPSLVGPVQVCVCVWDQCGNWRSELRRVHCLIGQMALWVSLSDAVAFKQNIHTHTDTTTPFLSHMRTRNYHFPFCLPHQPLVYLPEINLHLFIWKDAWRFALENQSKYIRSSL